VEIPESNEWNNIKAPVSGLKSGIQNLVLSLRDNKSAEVDWISFE
jgi:hypothetical protein